MRFTRFFLVLTLIILPTTLWADLEEGFQAYERGDYKAAVDAWLPLAEQGDVTAQFNLGQMYRLGKGVDRNDLEAVKWYKLAAQQGSPHAQHNLRLMHRDGRASQADYEDIFGKSELEEATAGTDSETSAPSSAASAPTPAPTPAPAEPVSTATETTTAFSSSTSPATAPVKPASSEPADIEPVSEEPITVDTAALNDSQMKKSQMESSSAELNSMTETQSPQQTAMIEKQPVITAPAPVTTTPAPATSSGGNWLQQLNPRDYVVQLVASPNQRGLNKFLATNRNAISSPLNTALTFSKGRQWHVVLMGPFSNRGQARSAISQLPANVQRQKPWIRQVSSVLKAAR